MGNYYINRGTDYEVSGRNHAASPRSKKRRNTKRSEFLNAMDDIIQWDEWVELILSCYSRDRLSSVKSPCYYIEILLRVYLMQNWFQITEGDLEDTIHDSIAMRDFIKYTYYDGDDVIEASDRRYFRRILEKNKIESDISDHIQDSLEEAGLKMYGGMIAEAMVVTSSNASGFDRFRQVLFEKVCQGFLDLAAVPLWKARQTGRNAQYKF